MVSPVCLRRNAGLLGQDLVECRLGTKLGHHRVNQRCSVVVAVGIERVHVDPVSHEGEKPMVVGIWIIAERPMIPDCDKQGP